MKLRNLIFSAAATAVTAFSAYETPYTALTREYQQHGLPSSGLTIVNKEMNTRNSGLGFKAIFPDAQIVQRDEATLDDLIDIIRESVKNSGTMEVFTLAADAVPNKILFSHRKSDQFSSFDFLNRLIDLQNELGKPIAKRIVFAVCNVITDQTPESKAFYLGAASALNAEIEGTTSNISIDFNHAARFVVFTPDGQVKRDAKLDVPNDPNVWRMERIRDQRRHRHDNILQLDS